MLVAIQSLIVFSPHNVWSQDFNNKALVHGALLGIGVLLVIIGVAVGLDRPPHGDYGNMERFSSAHGITGALPTSLSL